MKKLIIIATYNERDNILPLLQQIFNHVPDVHVLIVDDNSPDGTYRLVEEAMSKDYAGRLFLIKRAGKLGLGTAYVAGFNWALMRDYAVVMHMDADFSHDPKYLPNFFAAIKDYDLVLGSRYIKGGGVVNWGGIRKIISIGGSIYARTILGLKIRDLTGGFKCFRRETLEKIHISQLKANGYAFQVETTYRAHLAGCKIKELPIIFADRRVGQSKMSLSIFIEALWMIIRLKYGTIAH